MNSEINHLGVADDMLGFSFIQQQKPLMALLHQYLKTALKTEGALSKGYHCVWQAQIV